jgi:hypothetical protein
MKHLVRGVSIFVLALVIAGQANAQIPSCGGFATENDIWQVAHGVLAVKALGTTTRNVSGCLGQVQTEIWIEGVMGGAGTARGNYAASVEITRYVSHYGLANSISKHWWIWAIPESWTFLGLKHGQTNVEPVGPTGGGGGGEPDCGNGVSWSDAACDCGTHPEYSFCGSPVLLDTAGDGFQLTSVDRGVLFDLDCVGTLKKIAWTKPDSDDAWLALDRNGNGKIDNGCELFGNHTPAYANQTDLKAENGFVALRFLENPDYGVSHADGIIDRRDAPFAKLLLWRDTNHNGISEPDELTPVSQTDLLGISTAYKRTPRKDRHGNLYLLKAKSYWSGPNGAVETRPAYDVWLRTEENVPAGTSPE